MRPAMLLSVIALGAVGTMRAAEGKAHAEEPQSISITEEADGGEVGP